MLSRPGTAGPHTRLSHLLPPCLALPCLASLCVSRYFGSTKVAEAKLPFEAGFEAVGVVAAAAPDVQGIVPGQPVATMTYGGFAGAAGLSWQRPAGTNFVGSRPSCRRMLLLLTRAC